MIARASLLVAALSALVATGLPAFAQEQEQSSRPMLPNGAPPPFKPDATASDAATSPADGATPDTWIFSGALQTSHESFSGTLVTSKADTQFELKLAGGATCAGGSLKGEVGLVRLSEITCTDDRPMRALFVPQGGTALRVFGHVGEERFSTEAHLLGTEALPEKPQTKAPKAPIVPGLPLPVTPGGTESPK